MYIASRNTGWATWVSADLHHSKVYRIKGIYGNPKSLLIKTLEYNNSLILYYLSVLIVLSKKFWLKETRSVNSTSVSLKFHLLSAIFQYGHIGATMPHNHFSDHTFSQFFLIHFCSSYEIQLTYIPINRESRISAQRHISR